VRAGQDDRLAAVDLGDLRGQRVDGRIGDDLAAREGTALGECVEGLAQLGLGAVLAVLADGVEVDLAHRHRRRREHVACGQRPHRRLDARCGVLERQQHVVGDLLVQALVERVHLGGVLLAERLLDQEDDVVVLARVLGPCVVGHVCLSQWTPRILARS
jgi:hypothetical protein